jgi:hypothetical protein
MFLVFVTPCRKLHCKLCQCRLFESRSAHKTLLNLPCCCGYGTQTAEWVTVAGVLSSAECQSPLYELTAVWVRVFCQSAFTTVVSERTRTFLIVPNRGLLYKPIVTRVVKKFRSLCASEVRMLSLTRALQVCNAIWRGRQRRTCDSFVVYGLNITPKEWGGIPCSYVNVSLAGGSLVNLRRKLH